jgi:hypothetical protein
MTKLNLRTPQALWLLCTGVAMLRHSRLGARPAARALAIVSLFVNFNLAGTPIRRPSTSGRSSRRA